MTDTYIWQKVRQRFLSIDATIPVRQLVDGTEDEWEEVESEIIKKETDENGETTYTNVVDPNDVSKREDLQSKDEIWFEIFPLHSRPTQQELGTTGRNRWLLGFQININSPRNLGTYDIDAVYDAIAAQFKRGDIFDGIRVLQTAYRSSARFMVDYYSEPVTVMLQADLDN